MDDLISRQAAIDLLKQMRKDGDMIPWEGKDVFARIRKLPPAQPERKKGHWTRPSRENTYERFCSECGGKAWYCGKGDYPFCPNCGADMRGEDDD